MSMSYRLQPDVIERWCKQLLDSKVRLVATGRWNQEESLAEAMGGFTGRQQLSGQRFKYVSLERR